MKKQPSSRIIEKEKPLYIEGVFLYYDKENGNNRIYTKEIAKKIIEQFKEKPKGTVLGQCGYPENIVDLAKISHVVKDMWIDEEDQSIKGKIEVLSETGSGEMLKELLQTNVELSVALRGTGTISNDNEVTNYNFISADIVPKSSFGGSLKITDL